MVVVLAVSGAGLSVQMLDSICSKYCVLCMNGQIQYGSWFRNRAVRWEIW